MSALAPPITYRRIRTAHPLSFGVVRKPKVFIGPDHVLVLRHRFFSEQAIRLYFTELEVIVTRQDHRFRASLPIYALIVTIAAVMGLWVLGAETGTPGVVVGLSWISMVLAVTVVFFLKLADGTTAKLTLSTATHRVEFRIGIHYADSLVQIHLLPAIVSIQGAPLRDNGALLSLSGGIIRIGSCADLVPASRTIPVRFFIMAFGFSLLTTIPNTLRLFGLDVRGWDYLSRPFGVIFLCCLAALILFSFRDALSPELRSTVFAYGCVFLLYVLATLSLNVVLNLGDFGPTFFEMSTPRRTVIFGYFLGSTSLEIFALSQLLRYPNTYWGNPDLIPSSQPPETP